MSKERLVELLDEAFIKSDDNYGMPNVNQVADHLLADGWIRPPCKVGDKMYYDGEHFASHCKGEIMEATVAFINTEVCSTFRGEVDMVFDFDCFGKTVFLTREEAEAKLKESESK
jgi:hypothetical protein